MSIFFLKRRSEIRCPHLLVYVTFGESQTIWLVRSHQSGEGRLRHQSSTGKGQTVEELFEQHSEKLFAYLCQHTPSREDAEDILVDTFMAALAEAKFAHLPASGQVAWLWRVARNKVVDAFRKATLRRSVPLEQADETPCEEDARDPELAVIETGRATRDPQPLTGAARTPTGSAAAALRIRPALRRNRGHPGQT